MSTSRIDVSGFEHRIGYEFRDGSLLLQALTHSTYAYEHPEEGGSDNERLEFLGDSVLGLAVTRALFDDPSGRSEGEMTSLRARIVCEGSLAETARALQLGDALRLGIGEDRTGGRDKDSNLSNAMEAVFGAVLVDGGYEAAREVILRLMKPVFDRALDDRLVLDYKSRLYERVQSWTPSGTIVFRLLDERGEDHAKMFTSAVDINGVRYGAGSGSSKKESEQRASREAMERLNSGEGAPEAR